MKIKPLAVVCQDRETAAALVVEYAYIGLEARRRGRFVIVTGREVS